MWEGAIINNILDLLKIFLPAPIFGYLTVCLVDGMIKSWKLEGKRRRWILCSGVCMFVIVYFKYVSVLM